MKKFLVFIMVFFWLVFSIFGMTNITNARGHTNRTTTNSATDFSRRDQRLLDNFIRFLNRVSDSKKEKTYTKILVKLKKLESNIERSHMRHSTKVRFLAIIREMIRIIEGLLDNLVACEDWMHDEWGECISDIKSCDIENGIWEQTWVEWVWWDCMVVSCDSEYVQGWNSCEADTQEVECGWTIVENATATMTGTYEQTWNGSVWTPITSWWESQTTCDFDCNTNYTWNGTSCENIYNVAGLSSSIYSYWWFIHNCVLMKDKTVKCWGSNNYGQLWDGTNINRSTPVIVPWLTWVEQLVVWESYSCVLMGDKTVKCWGLNNYGQLWDGTNINRSTPVIVPWLTWVKQLSSWARHNCVLTEVNTVKCWGWNNYGQLWDGTNIDKLTPVIVPWLTWVKQLSSWGYHNCVIMEDETVKCWGLNNYGQIWDGTNINRSTPVILSWLTWVKQLSSWARNSCSILENGTVKCWGWNNAGQIWDGTNINKLTPVIISWLIWIKQINNWYLHTCAVFKDGAVKCWGSNNYGQIWDGTNINRSIPILVSWLTWVNYVIAWGYHSCAELEDGKIKCWGSNSTGQLWDILSWSSYTPIRSNVDIDG